MKTRVLAVLLAVCMIVGTCVLSASAANFAKDSYVELINPNGGLTADNIRSIGSNEFNIAVTATAKTSAEVNTGTTEVTADNVDSLVTFKRGTTNVTFKNDLASYYTVSGSISGTTADITFTSKSPANDKVVYKVKEAFETATFDSSKLEPVTPAEKYSLSPENLSVGGIKFVTKLSSVTIGVRFFGSTYDNLVASEIAQVQAHVSRNGNGNLPVESTVTSAVTNSIKDLMPGDEIQLVASLKNPEKDGKFYGFYCWVDGSGNVLGTFDKINYIVEGKDVAFYATYVELKNRHRISYTSNGNGKVIYNEAREVFNGNAQISVMDGKEATFTFVPDEGYEVAKVVIDGKTDVASFKSINLAALLSGDLSSLKNLINATNKDVYSYTFPARDPDVDHTIEVTYSPIAILEAPSGKDLPTVEAEGITLATGAAGENGEGGNGANGGNSANGTTVPGENGAAGSGSAIGGVVNPATGSTGAIAVFAALSVAAAAAFITAKKKED